MTKSQINKLGQKLRRLAELDRETLEQLQEFRASFDEPMFSAQTQLKELGFEATSRLKTINTIIEKLRREKTRLAEMQDIAGLRIVAKANLLEQDRIVSRIAETFSSTKVIDRRKKPAHGYRAVHVIATIDGRLMEIQVRTQLQDLWAQALERLADEAGREIRYGGPPNRRSEDVKSVLNLSNDIADIEVAFVKLRRMESNLPQPKRAPVMQRELRLHFAQLRSLRAYLRQREQTIRDELETIMAREGGS
jgi:ppGpp synthetase/RelA/SpoT-type nucleotidyltranferase